MPQKPSRPQTQAQREPQFIEAPHSQHKPAHQQRRMWMWISVVTVFTLVVILWIAANPIGKQDGSVQNPFATISARLKAFFSGTSFEPFSNTNNVNEERIQQIEEEVFPDLPE